jgi:hypothetical protein
MALIFPIGLAAHGSDAVPMRCIFRKGGAIRASAKHAVLACHRDKNSPNLHPQFAADDLATEFFSGG